MTNPHGPLRVGIGGPVGSGKTALMDALCKRHRDRYEIAAITNDIYTKWDAEYLVRSGALAPERIAGVETGGCPHTAFARTLRRISRRLQTCARDFQRSIPTNARFCRRHVTATDSFVDAPGSAAAVPGKIAAIELAAIRRAHAEPAVAHLMVVHRRIVSRDA
jgi:hypothetical protein